MKVFDRIQTLNDQAAEALKAVLHQVSAIKLKNIDTDSPEPCSDADFVAHIDVYGHSHTLVCMMMPGDNPSFAQEELAEFCRRAQQQSTNATPVVIAPRFSEDALAFCRENNAGLLDLQGNARINFGEVFIARHMNPLVEPHQLRATSAQTSHRKMRRRIAPQPATILTPAQGVIA